MAKNALAFAILNLVAFLNTSLVAQQTPGIGAESKRQHSILQRTGEPTPPAARVAKAPQLQQANPSPTEIQTPTTQERRVDNSESGQQPRLKKDADEETPVVELADQLKQAKNFDLSFNGPDQIAPGQLQVFSFKVTNLLETQSAPIVMRLGIPAGIEFVDSTIQARVDIQRSVIEWMVRPLAAGEAVEVNFRARGVQSGPQHQQLSIVHNAETIKEIALESFVLEQQSVRTRIVADSKAVTVGHPSQIEVVLTNLTQQMKRGLEVQVELPADVEVVESVLYEVKENVVTFQPIDIQGNQTRSVSLTLVGQEEGNSQMSAVVVSETQPISNKENAMLRFSRMASLQTDNPFQLR